MLEQHGGRHQPIYDRDGVTLQDGLYTTLQHDPVEHAVFWNLVFGQGRI
jgi:hypothetical protein